MVVKSNNKYRKLEYKMFKLYLSFFFRVIEVKARERRLFRLTKVFDLSRFHCIQNFITLVLDNFIIR